jgi:hypothetical protein
MSPMNNRLLRPRQTTHPEAANWAARVVANGGSVSGSTLSAVSRFCRAIDGAGIRDRFYRLNLFCGGTSGTAVGINSALVPLYRGQSLGGTQFGNTIDANAGGGAAFIGSDYAETGAGGGLLGSAASGKFLNTGFPTNTLAEGNRHISAYETLRSGQTFDAFLGSETAAGVGQQQFMMFYGGNNQIVNFGFGGFAASLTSTATTGAGHWLGVNSPSGTGLIYRNGSQDTTGTAATATPTSSSIFVFAINRAANATPQTDFFNGRLGGYSIGLAMTAPQAAAYYTAMQEFQTALSRNV